MEEYVTEILFASQRLRNIGKEVDDELLAALMLQDLSEEYEFLRMALDNTNEKITSDLVKTKLLQLNVKLHQEKVQCWPGTKTEFIIKITRELAMHQSLVFDVLYAMLMVIKR